jgi:hypothetical protein
LQKKFSPIKVPKTRKKVQFEDFKMMSESDIEKQLEQEELDRQKRNTELKA